MSNNSGIVANGGWYYSNKVLKPKAHALTLGTLLWMPISIISYLPLIPKNRPDLFPPQFHHLQGWDWLFVLILIGNILLLITSILFWIFEKKRSVKLFGSNLDWDPNKHY